MQYVRPHDNLDCCDFKTQARSSTGPDMNYDGTCVKTCRFRNVGKRMKYDERFLSVTFNEPGFFCPNKRRGFRVAARRPPRCPRNRRGWDKRKRSERWRRRNTARTRNTNSTGVWRRLQTRASTAFGRPPSPLASGCRSRNTCNCRNRRPWVRPSTASRTRPATLLCRRCTIRSADRRLSSKPPVAHARDKSEF